jgi:transcriptional regulator with XRE-family HTH domain
MKSKVNSKAQINRVLRDIILEASEQELREALEDTSEHFESLAAQGRAVFQRALDNAEKTDDLPDLHRGLGVLIQMLRRRERLSPEQLASKARIDVAELRRIELDPNCDPNPRTIFQLEQYFNLPSRVLVILSGAVRVGERVREEVVRFAASAQHMSELSREEQNLLNRFVKFLQEHTDR